MKKMLITLILGLGLNACAPSNEAKTQASQETKETLETQETPEAKETAKTAATAADYQTAAIAPNSILMGYLVEGQLPSDEQFSKMTHVAFSFLRASDSLGNITMTSGWDNLDQVIAAAHRNNVKAIISFGGGEFKVTQGLMGNKENRTTLITNIVAFMKEHNFDGFDSDWEPSWLDDKAEMEQVNNAITLYYLDFLSELRMAIDTEFGKGQKTLSAAVMNANSIWYSADKQISHFPQNGWWNYLDWVALMNYDNDLGAKHATFESVFGSEGSVAYWTGFGIPKSKIVVGVPFYARAGWGEEWLFYKDVVAMDGAIADSVDFITHDKGTGAKEYGFNGVATARAKVKALKEQNLPGIMFWQLGGDLEVTHEKSLLRVMSDERSK